MDCLKGYIGISPTVGEVESNLYLTELSGITIDNLDKIAVSPEQPSFEAVFHDCEKRAILSFKGAFTARINECFHICDSALIECLICEFRERLAPALWYAIGAEAMIERQGSDRLNRFTTIDRKKAGDLQKFFEERYEYELTNAVKSINPNHSACVAPDEEIEDRPLITFTECLP
ncbi:MAG: hypothetical protein LBS43_12530 [Prevotellaceae bacterium]|jgi:hypothetical protein|nr:hypothetical protein [Prevotellaceae bacterium]